MTRLAPVAKRINMAWLDRAACKDIDGDSFHLNGQLQLGPVQFEILARCDRCPVLDKCKEMYDNMTRSANANAFVAAGRIYGSVARPPYSRPLSPRERKAYEQWLDTATTKLLLW